MVDKPYQFYNLVTDETWQWIKDNGVWLTNKYDSRGLRHLVITNAVDMFHVDEPDSVWLDDDLAVGRYIPRRASIFLIYIYVDNDTGLIRLGVPEDDPIRKGLGAESGHPLYVYTNKYQPSKFYSGLKDAFILNRPNVKLP